MATLTPTVLGITGGEPTLVAAAEAGDKYKANGQYQILVVKNASASTAREVTIVAKSACNQGTKHDIKITVAKEKTSYISDIDESHYVDSEGYVNITYSSKENLTVGVFTPGG